MRRLLVLAVVLALALAAAGAADPTTPGENAGGNDDAAAKSANPGQVTPPPPQGVPDPLAAMKSTLGDPLADMIKTGYQGDGGFNPLAMGAGHNVAPLADGNVGMGGTFNVPPPLSEHPNRHNPFPDHPLPLHISEKDKGAWEVVRQPYPVVHPMTTGIGARVVMLLLEAQGYPHVAAMLPSARIADVTMNDAALTALKHFQTRCGLPATGIVDGHTWPFLIKPVKLMDTSPAVLAVASLLHEGFRYRDIEPSEFFGIALKNPLKDFQVKADLVTKRCTFVDCDWVVDGGRVGTRCGYVTWKALLVMAGGHDFGAGYAPGAADVALEAGDSTMSTNPAGGPVQPPAATASATTTPTTQGTTATPGTSTAAATTATTTPTDAGSTDSGTPTQGEYKQEGSTNPTPNLHPSPPSGVSPQAPSGTAARIMKLLDEYYNALTQVAGPNGVKVAPPYYLNAKRAPRSVARMKRAEGFRTRYSDITALLPGACKRGKCPLEDYTPIMQKAAQMGRIRGDADAQYYRQFLTDFGIGIDCSGYVSDALNYVCAQTGSSDKIATNSGGLKGGQGKFATVSTNDIRVGDTVWTNGHIRIVAQVVPGGGGVTYLRVHESAGGTGPIEKWYRAQNGSTSLWKRGSWRNVSNVVYGRYQPLARLYGN